MRRPPNTLASIAAALAFLLWIATSPTLAGAPENWPDGAGAPDWWPEAVALYPGSTVEGVDHAEDRGLPDVETLVPAEGASVEALEAWYRESLEAAGWEVWPTKEIPQGLRFTSQDKGVDQRIIVQFIRPNEFLWNKSDSPMVKITVYRSIP